MVTLYNNDFDGIQELNDHLDLIRDQQVQTDTENTEHYVKNEYYTNGVLQGWTIQEYKTIWIIGEVRAYINEGYVKDKFLMLIKKVQADRFKVTLMNYRNTRISETEEIKHISLQQQYRNFNEVFIFTKGAKQITGAEADKYIDLFSNQLTNIDIV